MSTEKIVEKLEIKRIADPDAYKKFDEDKYRNIDGSINMLANSINTEVFFNNVDKEELKSVLLHVKYKMADPICHVNWLLIVLTLVSFFVSLYTFYVTFWD